MSIVCTDRKKEHLVAARVIQAVQMCGLGADDWELYLELVEHTERLVELRFDVWHVSAEGIFVGATIVALEY
jgi:hypothetical protein